LQGWAIVDNTIGEDWNGVQLSLISGAPQSFIQELSQPYYARRPVVPMPEAFEVTPQTHEGTLEEPTSVPQIAAPPPPAGVGGGMGSGSGGGIAGGTVGGPVSNTYGAEYGRNTGTAYFYSTGAGLFGTVKDPMGAVIAGATVTLTEASTGQSQSTRTDASGMYRFKATPSANSQLRVDAPNFQSMVVRLAPGAGRRDVTLNVGAASETVTVEDQPSRGTIAEAISSLETETASGEVGDLFEYDVKQKITILKNQSALVPIAQAPIEAEKVTLWSGDEDAAPLRTLWLTNTSGLTLDAGTFNVLEDETFAGEGLLETIKPGERRLLSYAVDQSVRVSTKEEGEQEPISHVSVLQGVMKITREERATKTYTVRNSDTSPRAVILEHPVRDEWKLVGNLKPEETSATHYRFRVNVAPGATEKLAVEEAHPLETSYALTNLTSKDVELWAQQKRLTPEMEQAFRRVLAQKNVVSGLDAQMRAAQQQVETITVDQGRLRENMKALKGSAEERALLQRYTRELNSQEDQLDKLRSELADLKGKRAQAAAELDRIIQEIALEATF
ncbi:MAG TPA: carboxypeptidase regulatory-like domain-containing protein, partial [Terriglobales bacterium]|nr:carboxypeptidase regulatory-like domain-containing protein [Terriglobales bacterium]